MFDLDLIENDWIDNSFKLNEEDIIKIYQSEGVTLSNYSKAIEEYKKKTTLLSPEERLLCTIFNDKNELLEKEKELKEKYSYPKKKRLSQEKQKIVVEGCLDKVFDSTREWFDFFDGKISLERLYYVCLEALINSVKYTMHCEKPVFFLLVIKSIRRNIIKYVARWEHMTYRNLWQIIDKSEMFDYSIIKNKLKFDYEDSDILISQNDMNYLLRNEFYDIDYIKNISSNEFIVDYNKALDKLGQDTKQIMNLIYDNQGNRCLTYKEIEEILGVDAKKVQNIKKNAIKKLRLNNNLNKYR